MRNKTLLILIYTGLLFSANSSNADGGYSAETIAGVAKSLSGSSQTFSVSQIEGLMKSLANAQAQVRSVSSELERLRDEAKASNILRPSPKGPSQVALARDYSIVFLADSLDKLKDAETLAHAKLLEAWNTSPGNYNSAFYRYRVVPGVNRKYGPNTAKAVGALGTVALTIAGVVYYFNFHNPVGSSDERADGSEIVHVTN